MKASAEQLVALRAVARALGSLLDEVVFVGGMTSGLLITDPGAPTARPTDDVDLIIEVASTVEYQTQLRKRLRVRGFREDTREGAPHCRWLLDDTFVVDVMPTNPSVLGFSNRWYAHAIKTAKSVTLPPDLRGAVSLNVITATAFCATKLEAWHSRGNDDLFHHDIEDFVALADGRAELLAELESETPELRKFVADAVHKLLAAGLDDQLAGHLAGDAPSQARLPAVQTTLNRIARHPKLTKLGERLLGTYSGTSWDLEVLRIENVASTSRAGRSAIAVIGRLTPQGSMAQPQVDSPAPFIEDSSGNRYFAKNEAANAETHRQKRFKSTKVMHSELTTWVYELPVSAKGVRLVLPFENAELPFERP